MNQNILKKNNKMLYFKWFLLLFIVQFHIVFAQKNKDWLEHLPKSETGNYKFYVGTARHVNTDDAFKMAWDNVVMQINNESGVKYSIQGTDILDTRNKQINDSVHTEVEFISKVVISSSKKEVNIKMLLVDKFYKTINNQTECNILIRIPVNENTTNENVYIKYIQRDFSYRTFFPGWSQFYKNQNFRGSLFIGFTTLSIGTILWSQYAYNKNYKNHVNSLKIRDFKAADIYKSNYNSWYLSRNISIAVLSFTYILNFIDALQEHKTYAYRWYILPISTPDMTGITYCLRLNN